MNQVVAEKLVRHPVRVQIVALLAEKTMSPQMLAKELGVTLGTMAYHVRTLEGFGAIRLVKEERVRGAVEHFYTLRNSAKVKEAIRTALIKMRDERSAAEQALARL